MTFFDPVTRMKRMLVKAGRCYNAGESRKAADLAHRALALSTQVPQEAMTAEIRRLGSDLAVVGASAHGRLERFHVALAWARQSVQRDETNPNAYEALGLGLAMNGQTVEARAKFMEGLRLAQESRPVDTEAEERINRQVLWLNKNESTLNNLYQRAQLEAKTGAEEETKVRGVWGRMRVLSHYPPPPRGS